MHIKRNIIMGSFKIIYFYSFSLIMVENIKLDIYFITNNIVNLF